MTFKVDYLDGDVLAWSVAPSGAACERVSDYTPTVYVSAPDRSTLDDARGHVRQYPGVERTATESWRTGWRRDPEPVLRVDVHDLEAVTTVASAVRGWGNPGTYRCYNVDFSREFRYCLETDLCPVPDGTLTTTTLSVPDHRLARGDLIPLAIGGDRADGTDDAVVDTTADAVLDAVADYLDRLDPDVLVLSSSELVPALFDAAERLGRDDFRLGRLPGYRQLAGQSTYESYGHVGNSPARYSVPGRAIVDCSNTFFWTKTNLAGVLDLVRRSYKPLQECSWASIGNVLTAIQIRHALDAGVLVPWNSWRHEFFKTMSTLHEADRGGFTFSPETGVHEDVHELDFSSLYPNIIVTRNVSPETIRCACHRDRADVPGLGYSICDERGYLGDVLKPIVDDRDKCKVKLAATTDPDRERELRGRSAALKWILVSCFGYQGFSNAKFGRIECHEAINAFAREILLDTKQTLEANGWHLVHGIVDSVWVTPDPDLDQTPLHELCRRITDDVGIRLEYERAFDWIAFVPRRSAAGGALNRYFGTVRGADDYKLRGIECRQRSTPAYVADTQRELIATFDETRDPVAMYDVLRERIAELHAGAVSPTELVVRRRVSKPPDEYTRSTRAVAALERSERRGVPIPPGGDVRYVVVDDDRRSRDRVHLAFESPTEYDTVFYEQLLVRAAESVLSPLGWTVSDQSGRMAALRRRDGDDRSTAASSIATNDDDLAVGRSLAHWGV